MWKKVRQVCGIWGHTLCYQIELEFLEEKLVWTFYPNHCKPQRGHTLLQKAFQSVSHYTVRVHWGSHTFFFNSQEALQLPLQNPYCCMQYAYNLNIVISHDSAPWPSCFYICHSLNTIFWSPKNVVPTLKCASMSLWCLSSVSELSNVSAVSALFIFAVTCDLSSAVQRIVGQNSQKCGVHLYDILVFFGTLHFTFSHWDILNIFVTY